MKRPLRIALGAFFFCTLCSAFLVAQSDVLKQLEEIAIVDQKVMMPMRDGVRLATDIYRPKTDEKVNQ